MTMLAPIATGASLGDWDDFAAHEPTTVARCTPVAPMNNPGLSSVLNAFDHPGLQPLALLNGFWGLRYTDAPLADSDLHLGINAWQPCGVDDHSAVVAAGVARRPRHLTLLLGSAASSLDIDLVGPWQVEPGIIDDLREDAPQPVDNGSIGVILAVEQLAAKLGLPVRDVLAAAGIKRSSFYSWRKGHVPQPRVASQARLWELTQTVADLTEILTLPLRDWLLASKSRRRALLDGHFDDLLAEASPLEAERPSDTESVYSVGGDRDLDDRGGTTPTKRGQAYAATIVTASDRHRLR